MDSQYSKLYLLLSTVAVFFSAANGERLRIYEHSTGAPNCPWGSVKIQSAFFGQNQTLDCPGMTNTPQACSGSNDYAIVARECDGKKNCSLYASNSVFGDPCPGRGKYLDVTFSCVSTVNICENDSQTISCYSSRHVRILSAEYGRTAPNACNDSAYTSSGCTAPNALAIVKASCEDRFSCTLQASTSVFGDPCPGYGKYLKVTYYCW